MTTHTTQLAILGGPSAHQRPAPKYPPVSDEACERISAALRSGPAQSLSKGHPIIAELEQSLARYHDVPHVLAGSSGHGALHSALIGLEITGGDEVLTSPYSWGASVSCILHNGAVPVFVDVFPDTGLIDPAALEAGLSAHTRAILVPHLYGQPADMTAIMAFAENHDLVVIEDGSQAHGAKHRGQRIGSFGHAGGFSTNGVKPLATTEGGYMTTRLSDVYWKATISAQHAGRGELLGRASEPGFPDSLRGYIDSLVYTYRPNIVTGLLTLDRLPHLDQENAARRRNAETFFAAIEGLGSVSWPSFEDGDECVYHMVTLNFDRDSAGISRDTYIAALNAEGVPALAYVAKSLHRSPRLSPDWDGPRVMWTRSIREAGIDLGAQQLPGCEAKVERSTEIPWNFFREDPELIESLANAFVKVEENLEQLREYERRG